jgi:glycosyltransferase involved in cell wall biosynthesis
VRRVLEVLGTSAGGIARHVAQLVTDLDARADLVVDVAGPSGLPVRMPKPMRPTTVPRGLLGHRRAISALRAHIDDGTYDVVHAHGLRAGIDGALAARASGRPAVVTVHNLVRAEVAGPRAPLLRWSEPLVVRLATHVFAVSREVADRLRSAAPRHASKVEVLHLGIGAPPAVRRDAEAARAALGVANGRLVVTAARLRPQKALEVMLRAIARLPGDVTLAVFGEGPQRERLEALGAALGIARRIRFLGWRDDLADYVAAADVFCLSSAWEGVPLAAQEAILLGTPVVATNVGGMHELVVDGVSGRLVPRGDAAALARALEDVLAATDTGAAFAARARRDLLERFSAERMLDRVHEVYLALSAG